MRNRGWGGGHGLSDGYDGGKTEDGGESRLQTIHMQMRDRTWRRDQGLSDGYIESETDVGMGGTGWCHRHDSANV